MLRSREGEVKRLQLLIETKNIKIEHLEENINLQNKVIDNLKNNDKIKEKDNIGLVAKYDEAQDFIDKLKATSMKEESDLTKQKSKAIEEFKI